MTTNYYVQVATELFNLRSKSANLQEMNETYEDGIHKLLKEAEKKVPKKKCPKCGSAGKLYCIHRNPFCLGAYTCNKENQHSWLPEAKKLAEPQDYRDYDCCGQRGPSRTIHKVGGELPYLELCIAEAKLQIGIMEDEIKLLKTAVAKSVSVLPMHHQVKHHYYYTLHLTLIVVLLTFLFYYCINR